MVRECVGVLPCKITRNKYELMLSKDPFLSETWGELTKEIDSTVEEKVDYTLKHYGEFFEDLKPRLTALQAIKEGFELRENKTIVVAKDFPQKIHPLILSILLNSLYLVSKTDNENEQQIHYSYAFVSPFELKPADNKRSFKWMEAEKIVSEHLQLKRIINPKVIQLAKWIVETGQPSRYAMWEAQSTTLVSGEMEEILPYICKFDMPAPTYPPFTTSNCYIVGNEIKYIIDPGTTSIRHLKKLVDFVEKEQETIEGIILTHHHVDNTSQSAYLKARFHLPILASKETAEILKQKGIETNLILKENDTLSLGSYPPMRLKEWNLKVLECPGHTSGDLCLMDNRGVIFLGDILFNESHTLVDPSWATVKDLLKTLKKIKKLNINFGLAGHGTIVTKVKERINENIRLRNLINLRIIEGLKNGLSSLEELSLCIKDCFGITTESLLRSTIMNHLKLLKEYGFVQQRGSDYCLKKERLLAKKIVYSTKLFSWRRLLSMSLWRKTYREPLCSNTLKART
ncbi:MAG: MBL fold metallo-hydrolase [Candidatus Heimdallarchaeaceae archaeon]